MEKKHYLIVGASSVAGQKTIEAIRNKDASALITVTSSKIEGEIEGLTTIHGVDLIKPDSLSKIKSNLIAPINFMIFCPAFGMVGYPPEIAPITDVEACFDFSVRPVLKLIHELKPQLTIAFSSYYWLKSLELAYGSMAFAKYALEKLAVENPNQLRIVRAGLFPSKSLRGICLLIQRGVQRENFPGSAELKAEWKDLGLSFSDFFVHFAQKHEKENLKRHLTQTYRGTEAKDLVPSIETALSPDAKAIINVVGDSLWQEETLLNVPDFMMRNKEAFRLAENFKLL